jgi:hypothetical protein
MPVKAPSMALRRRGAYHGVMKTDAQVLQRWRDLRAMLIDQLDMFEKGSLVLRSNGVNISAAAVTDLKRSILDFDALITKGEADA